MNNAVVEQGKSATRADLRGEPAVCSFLQEQKAKDSPSTSVGVTEAIHLPYHKQDFWN
tara:strand:+ start:13283 stop:13456 length:174 start_codon:yes stop_codon:yes gene_type:complete